MSMAWPDRIGGGTPSQAVESRLVDDLGAALNALAERTRTEQLSQEQLATIAEQLVGVTARLAEVVSGGVTYEPRVQVEPHFDMAAPQVPPAQIVVQCQFPKRVVKKLIREKGVNGPITGVEEEWIY